MRNIYRSLFAVLAVSVGAVLGLASAVLQPTLRYIAHGCEALASGIDKLDRELAHKLNEQAIGCDEVSSDLKRESNGYRQSSASDELKGSPAMA